NGNTATCSATVTVEDNVAPDVVTQDITIQLDDQGNATIEALEVDGGSTDACGIDSYSVSPSSFDCSNIGDNTVTLTVIDIYGNSASNTAVVTVEDMVNPIAVCNDITIYLDPDGTYTLSQSDIDTIADGSTDNCDNDLTYSVSPSSFTCAEEGDNTVTLTVTDDYGNSATCTAVVTVDGSFPEVTISQSELPEFCQGAVVVLTANSDEAVEYLWNSGEETASIEVAGNGIYGVLVTSATNCTAYTEFEVTGFDAGSLTAAYTILAEEDVFLHGNNLVQSGAVGAMNPNIGNIKLHQATTVVDFAQAVSLDLNQGSVVTGGWNPVAANPTIPAFVFNTLSNNSSPDVTVNNNQTQTLNGSVYDVITVKQNATVIFSQSNVYINELKTFDGASIEFENCANVFINDKFMLAQNGTINDDDPNKVVFYVNEDVQIEKESNVRASIHAYYHELLVKGNQNGAPTYMTGLFIANRVHGNKNVIWNADDLCDPCPIDQPVSGGTDVSDNNDLRMGIDMEVVAWPNPSNSNFNLRLKTAISTENVTVEVFDMNNRLVHKGDFKFDGTHIFGDKLDGGVYIVKVTQSGIQKSVRLVRY
ncbi:T9SS type A sorting domain-containing protein, partial [Hanstruepera ponticola]|uniref:T9SS type A sorting domain-containing protein n=1 Tax=Hanstruepera ponticola TaxID=2042995 RepID=UPI00177C3D41